MRETVRAKKHLGQHFLNDLTIAENIVDALSPAVKFKKALEVGPGMGVLTQFLLQKTDYETTIIDIDTESIAFLQKKFPSIENRIIAGDFLKLNLEDLFNEPFAIVGNFPYNISSQILFKMLEHRDKVPVLVGMFQKEVAQRIAAPPKNKTYGILSVFLQAFYDIEYLFTVNENVFTPPPKVKSAVIRCTRNETHNLGCDEKLFIKVVKAGFNQRRKTLRNSLKPFIHDKPEIAGHPFFAQRAEELSVENFVELTNLVQKSA
jgi:16S rRNA (adenine1518-N6/adenine1519-N6)-dimethyltransferase